MVHTCTHRGNDADTTPQHHSSRVTIVVDGCDAIFTASLFASHKSKRLETIRRCHHCGDVSIDRAAYRYDYGGFRNPFQTHSQTSPVMRNDDTQRGVKCDGPLVHL